MNKILSCLLLFIALNIQATNKKKTIYTKFVNEMKELEPKALLSWFMEVSYTKDSLNLVLNNLISQEVNIVNQLMNEKNIDKILQYYIDSKKNASTSKSAKEDSEYAKELIDDVLNSILGYLRSSIEMLYEVTNDDKEPKLIELFNLEVEDEYKKNNFLAIQKNILLNKLKAIDFNANYKDSFANKTLLELQEEYKSNHININIKKAALVVFHLNSIAHRVAQGDGDEFISATSHAKFIIGRITTIKDHFDNFNNPFESLAFTLPSTSNKFEGKREQGKIIPAIYKYIVSMPVTNEREKVLIGNLKFSFLPADANAALEQAIRDNKFEIEEIKIDESRCLKNIQVQSIHKELLMNALYKEGDLELPVKIYRNLYLLGNKFEIPATWNSLQTNLFMSEVVNTTDNSIYPTNDKKFKPNIELFINNAGYIKILQHALNYNNFRYKFPKTTKGYFGTKSIVPRTIVLGNHTDFYRVQKNGKDIKGQQIPDDTFFAINTNFYNQQDKAYVCKNNTVPGQNFSRKQMCIAIMGYTEELSLTILEQLAKKYSKLLDLCCTYGNLDKDKVLQNLSRIFYYLQQNDFQYDILSIKETDGSTSYYCVRPEQLYLENLIEYRPSLLQQMP